MTETERVTPEEEAALYRHLRERPVTRTRRAHAKMLAALRLAIDVCDELVHEARDHVCEDGDCDSCGWDDHADGIAYMLCGPYTLLFGESADTDRLGVFAEQLNSLLNEWLDADRESGNPPAPDAIR